MKKIIYALTFLFFSQITFGQQRVTVKIPKTDLSGLYTKTQTDSITYVVRTQIPSQFNPIAGTNMSLSGTYPNITFNATGGGAAIDTTNKWIQSALRKNDSTITTTKNGTPSDITLRFPSVISYGKNAGKDSTVILLSNGTIFAAKDSVGSGGGGTPAGSNTYVQFNNSGSFGADAGFTWNNTTKSLVVTGGASTTSTATFTNNISNTSGIDLINTSSGGGSNIGLFLTSDNGTRSGQLFKYSSTNSGYKSILANDLGFYNGPTSGNITLFNDYTSGNINFTAGGASAAQMTLSSSGKVGIGATPTTDRLSVYGDIALTFAGNKLKITEGTNGSVGQTTLVAGTKAITISGVTTSTRAFVTLVSQGGTVTTTVAYAAVCTSGTLTITALTNTGTTDTTDTSVLNYFIIN